MNFITKSAIVGAGALALGLAGGQASANEVDYTVKAGDTLAKIAETQLGDVNLFDELAAVNGIENPNLIFEGQTLTFDGVKEGAVATAVNAQGTQAQSTEVAASTYNAAGTSATYQAPVQSYQAAPAAGGSVRLSNGNAAGTVGAQAATQMAARTGVPASTWEYIIARESNGQADARNASGAAGLFQTMPVHGSTATVSDQINSAVRAYNAQGLSAWGM